MITQELKTRWVEALRSGKYKQGKNYLKNDDGTMCCMGVLCDIIDPAGWSIGYRVFWHEEYECYPPHSIIDIRNSNHLGIMNDEDDMNFDQIADWIEKNFTVSI